MTTDRHASAEESHPIDRDVDDAPPDRGPGLVRRGLAAVVVAVVANAAVVLAAVAAGVAPGFRPLSLPPVVFLTAAGVVGATATYWLVARRSPRPNRTFTIVAAVALLVSFLPDVGLLRADPAATLAGVLVLMFMHAVAAGISVYALARWRR